MDPADSFKQFITSKFKHLEFQLRLASKEHFKKKKLTYIKANLSMAFVLLIQDGQKLVADEKEHNL